MTDKVPPTFQFYASDFVGGTMGFTAEQTGAFILLLCYEWMNGSIPSDDAMLCGIGRCSSDALAVVKRKFNIALPDGNLQNRKLEDVRSKQAAFRQKQAESGRKGGLSSKHRQSEPKAPLNQASSEPQALQSPSPSTERESGEASDFPEIPPMPRKQFDELVKMRAMTPEFGEWFWNTHDARDWKDGKGVQITKLEPALLNAWKSWRGNIVPTGAKQDATPPKPAGPKLFMKRWGVNNPPTREQCTDDSQFESFRYMWGLFFEKELEARKNGGQSK